MSLQETTNTQQNSPSFDFKHSWPHVQPLEIAIVAAVKERSSTCLSCWLLGFSESGVSPVRSQGAMHGEEQKARRLAQNVSQFSEKSDRFRFIQMEFRWIQIYSDEFRFIQMGSDLFRWIQLQNPTLRFFCDALGKTRLKETFWRRISSRRHAYLAGVHC